MKHGDDDGYDNVNNVLDIMGLVAVPQNHLSVMIVVSTVAMITVRRSTNYDDRSVKIAS